VFRNQLIFRLDLRLVTRARRIDPWKPALSFTKHSEVTRIRIRMIKHFLLWSIFLSISTQMKIPQQKSCVLCWWNLAVMFLSRYSNLDTKTIRFFRY
jgi:hypothetical protein